ncbi:hypothetical protein ACI3L3_11820 [Desulfobaculum sp. SPO524]|uniref:hypothetical protein n=1 Tax=Desulfobaculum sp. SPO524 TaxID=3378071 RepID=UPI003851E83B
MEDGYVSLANLKGGAAIEAFDYCLSEAWDNILDPNTDPKKKRKVTLEITLTPSADRQNVTCQIGTKTALAPQAPMDSTLYVDKDQTGTAVAAELGPYNPGQHLLPEVEPDNVTPFRKAGGAN